MLSIPKTCLGKSQWSTGDVPATHRKSGSASIFIKKLDFKTPRNEWIRIDPAINKAADILVAEKILQYEDGRYSINPSSVEYFNRIEQISDLSTDNHRIKDIAKSITEKQCQDIMKGVSNA